MTSLTFQISFLFDVAINTNHLFLIFFLFLVFEAWLNYIQ